MKSNYTRQKSQQEESDAQFVIGDKRVAAMAADDINRSNGGVTPRASLWRITIASLHLASCILCLAERERPAVNWQAV